MPYFIMNIFSSCLGEVFAENGERIDKRIDNLPDFRWILIYEYGEICLNLDELFNNANQE